jgi:hypothetical protein
MLVHQGVARDPSRSQGQCLEPVTEAGGRFSLHGLTLLGVQSGEGSQGRRPTVVGAAGAVGDRRRSSRVESIPWSSSSDTWGAEGPSRSGLGEPSRARGGRAPREERDRLPPPGACTDRRAAGLGATERVCLRLSNPAWSSFSSNRSCMPSDPGPTGPGRSGWIKAGTAWSRSSSEGSLSGEGPGGPCGVPGGLSRGGPRAGGTGRARSSSSRASVVGAMGGSVPGSISGGGAPGMGRDSSSASLSRVAKTPSGFRGRLNPPPRSEGGGRTCHARRGEGPTPSWATTPGSSKGPGEDGFVRALPVPSPGPVRDGTTPGSERVGSVRGFGRSRETAPSAGEIRGNAGLGRRKSTETIRTDVPRATLK